MTQKTVHILLVDDDDVEAEAVIRAFAKQRIANPIVRARDGLEALQRLKGEGDPARPLLRPYLILLDLNMPRMDGFEFLDAVRLDPLLHDSLIFVLTTSNEEQDKVSAYKHNVAGYLVKDQAGADFVKLISMLDSYWRYVEFPPLPALHKP